jgi:hypothetical protein
MISHDGKARLAEAILANRAQRRTLLPTAIFGELPWDALLMLFAADAVSQRITGRDIASSVSCSEQVMSRWLVYLSKQELVVGDETGNLDDLLTLAPAAIVAIERYLEMTQNTAEQLLRKTLRSGPQDDLCEFG